MQIRNYSNHSSLHAVIQVPEDNYLAPLWRAAFEARGITTTNKYNRDQKIFHYCEYDDIDLDRVQQRDGSYLSCSFIYRKALIRKHYMSNTIAHYVAKNPSSILKFAYPESYNLEVDYAEFLDDSLDESFELRNEIENNNYVWILKPSMGDRAQGIRLFSTVDQLQQIFDDFDDGVETDNEEDEEVIETDENRGVVVSQMRHFVCQRYLENPLLLDEYDQRKFHLRVYVLAVGAIKVYVYNSILVLFSESTYEQPAVTEQRIPLDSHLTNTCAQDAPPDVLVGTFNNLKGISEQDKKNVFDKVCECTGELFKAAVTVDRINYQPIEHGIEFYGLDYLVADDLSIRLLEVNAYPDFKQTGSELKQIVGGLINATVDTAILPFYGMDKIDNDNLVNVLSQNVYNN